MPFRNAEVVITDSTTETNAKPYSERIKGQSEYIELTNAGQSTEYMNLLANALDNAMNGPQFKTEIMGESPVYRFHPAGTAPTPIVVPTLADRSVSVNMRDPYTNNPTPAKIDIKQGETVVSKTSEDAFMLSLAIERHDFEMDGVMTQLTLQQEAERVAEQIDEAIATGVMKLMLNDPNNAAYLHVSQWVGPLSTAKLRDEVEDQIDACVQRGRLLGHSVEDFMFGVSAQAYQALGRIARKAGFSSPSDYLGTKVYSFGQLSAEVEGEDGEEVMVICVPKRHVAISWRENPATGKWCNFIVSRKGNTQSTTMEILGTADLIIAGQTKAIQQVADGPVKTIEVNLPLIQMVTGKVA